LEAFVNNPNIKAISIAAYERSFVVLYEEATSDLRENKHNRRKMAGKERNG